MKRPLDVPELMEQLLAAPLEYYSGAEARERFKDMVEHAKQAHVLITNHGKPQAALISIDAFQAVQQLILRLARAQLAGADLAKPLRFEDASHPDEAGAVAEAVERAGKRVAKKRAMEHGVAG